MPRATKAQLEARDATIGWLGRRLTERDAEIERLRAREAVLTRLEAAIADGTFSDAVITAGHRAQVVMWTFDHPEPEFAGLTHGEWQQMHVKRVLQGALLAAKGDQEGLERLIGGPDA